jgi:hypothetical protein
VAVCQTVALFHLSQVQGPCTAGHWASCLPAQTRRQPPCWSSHQGGTPGLPGVRIHIYNGVRALLGPTCCARHSNVLRNLPISPPTGRGSVPDRGPVPPKPSAGSLYSGPLGLLPASPNAPPATLLVQPSGRCPGLQPGLPGGRMPPGKPHPGRNMGGRHQPARRMPHSGSHHLQKM